MPMEVLYAQPYLQTETSPPVGFPQTIDILIGGHQYVVNTSFEPYRRDAFRHRSIQAQRESISLDNLPGEGTVNTEGLWRREAWDWHFGAGQPYQDRKDSVDARFSISKGVDPWMQWQLSLLNDTRLVTTCSGNAQVLQVGAYVYVLDIEAQTLRFTSDFNTWTTPEFFYTSPIFDLQMMATDGFNLWIADASGQAGHSMWQTQAGASGATAVVPYVTTGQLSGVWYVGDRLMATWQNNVYNITVPETVLPAALWTAPNAATVFSSMGAGSSQIYLGAYTGGSGQPLNSVVYRTTIEATGTALTIPVQALPMEGGEYCTSLYGYLNYIFVGSNLGIRMCRTIAAYDPTGNEGDLEAGPLIPGLFPPGPVNTPVYAFTANNRFVYFGWNNYDDVSTGLGRCDLSTFVDTQAPAFASDLMVTGEGIITSMDWCTINGAPIFVVANKGIYTGTNTPVPSGYVQSGQIGYGISDDKILWAGGLGTVQPQLGTVTMSVAVDGAAQTVVGTQNATNAGGSPIQSIFTIGQVRGSQTTVQVTLTAGGGVSPVLDRWTLKALPAITAGTTISAVILLYETVSQRGADEYYAAYAEYQYLYNLRTTQTLVEYQEGPFSAMCVIDELDWLPFKQHDSSTEGGFIGDLIVYLKTVDPGA